MTRIHRAATPSPLTDADRVRAGLWADLHARRARQERYARWACLAIGAALGVMLGLSL